MKEMSWVTRADHVISPVLGHYTQVEVAYGRGCYLYDRHDKAYLDFSSGIAVTSTGHCHPEVVSAIQRQAAQLIHGCIGVVYYEPPVTLAETIGRICGGRLDTVFFTQSGTEAMEAALKLVKYVSRKPKVVVFEGGFHGRTLGALSLTTSNPKFRAGYGALIPGVEVFPYPRQASDFELFEKWITPQLSDIGAIIIEPMLGEGGYIPAPDDFLRQLSTFCSSHGVLLVFDEIQTGFGRSGTWFWYQQLGIEPDVVAMAKGMASGMPLGAIVASHELMSRWTTGAHGGTYGANPVSCAASLATIGVLERVLPNVSTLSKLAFAALCEPLKNVPHVRDIRGRGLMIGIQLDTAERAADVRKGCLEKGLIVVCCGRDRDVIRLMPPLIIDEETLKRGLEMSIEGIHETQ